MVSLTPDSKKVGLGMASSPSPFLTPRPERRRADPRGIDWTSNRLDKDKETNVQVLLRCRPLSEDEQKSNVPRVISCNEHKREVTVMQTLANKQVDRVFTFDKVFGPRSQQRSIYEHAIAPVVNEVLDGFNCTVFAYGQTGTGKTYTMEGGMRNKGGDLAAEAGVIPRAVRHIFDMLEAQNADYSMKVTFLELYNEEITDLLAPEDNSKLIEDKHKRPVTLMEDGKGCVVVRGLEEESVYSVNEIYALLERGAAKRRTADTLLNKRSSRSHSVFSITIHVKESAIGDEELIKCGKLNLVDLAGSENISRSGAREGRAREAGEINKSLLTLGRVINALVEHSTHVPYRDSKLTRLLRDSLGGKTKTCIIATVSPSAYCLDETLSTLDYASRAKNIKNRPEANQKISKAVLLKDLYLEIERMKEDIRAARERNGVYIPFERYAKLEAEKKETNEKIEQLENDLNLSEKEVQKFQELYLAEQESKLDLESELNDCKKNLKQKTRELLDLQENYRNAISMLKEKEFTIQKLLQSESSLIERAKELCTHLHSASNDITLLSSKLDEKDKMEADNHKMILKFRLQLDDSLKDLHNTVWGSVSQQQKQLRCIEEHVRTHLASKCDETRALESRIKKMWEIYSKGVITLNELASTLHGKASSDMELVNSKVSSHALAVEDFLATAVLEVKEVICNILKSLDGQKDLLAFYTSQQEQGLQKSLASAEIISVATINFLDDIHDRASQVITVLEESQIERSNQLAKFEKSFKEEAKREEDEALEKIAAILTALTSKRSSRVSEASRNIQELIIKDDKRLQREISEVLQVSNGAKKEVGEYVEKVKSHFMKETFSTADSRAMMENCLVECSKEVEYSGRQWINAQLSINNLNKGSVAEIESMLKENISKYHLLNQEYVSTASTVVSENDEGTLTILNAVNGLLVMDHENKNEVELKTKMCRDELKSMQEEHGQSVSIIQNQAETCIMKDYLIDEQSGLTPKKGRGQIAIPEAASFEEMRTPYHHHYHRHVNIEEEVSVSLENNDRMRWAQSESKIPRLAMSLNANTNTKTNRAPFAEKN